MTKVLVLSDSHGLTEEIMEIKERHQIEYRIHCGDSELSVDAPELHGFLSVGGNCDHDLRFPDEQTVKIGGLTYYITHGHLHNVRNNLLRLAYRAEEKNAHVVCFGHTHFAGVEKIGDQLFVNPGSIHMPRNRVEKTYAIMEWEELSKVQVEFYTITGKLIDELSYKTSF